MPAVGDWTQPYVLVYPFDVTTAAVLTVDRPDGATETPVLAAPTTEDIVVDGATVTARRYTTAAAVEYALAGWWVFDWDTTGVGAGNKEQRVFVDPPQVAAALPVVDPTTDLGMIRTLATDLNLSAPLFSDAQLAAFLAMEGSVRRAAALALETIAVSEALISKRIKTLDLSTDGPAVAKELRERAAQLRAQQQKLDDETATADDIMPVWSFPDAPAWADTLL